MITVGDRSTASRLEDMNVISPGDVTMRLLWIAISAGLLAGSATAQPKPKSPPATGVAVPEFEEIDKMALDFLAEQKFPGMSVAVAKDGRLLYARGFGHAEPERRNPVQPTSLFRISSISKAITSAAICQMVDRNQLKFDDSLLDILKLKNLPAKMDPRWKDIKIVYLFTHSGGFDRDKDGDPMFRAVEISQYFKTPSPPSRDQIIRFMLHQSLDFDPGTKQVYSNFGYCLLGRVIEKVSGKPYDKYVIEELLKPLGITDMQIGKTLTTAKGEVKYIDTVRPTAPSVFATLLGKQVPSPYGSWSLEAMDAHGGWIASAVDLARFGVAFDLPDKYPAYKGFNLQSRFGPEYFYTGALDGTSASFHRLNGLVFVSLFNSRTAKNEKNLAEEFNPKLKEFLGKVKKWPEGDQFKQFYK
jgi:CubicO group peptidase (beta-lactamase class C family)